MYKHKLIDFVVQFMEEIDSEVPHPPIPATSPTHPTHPPALARPPMDATSPTHPPMQISAMKIQVNERARTIAFQYLKEFCT